MLQRSNSYHVIAHAPWEKAVCILLIAGSLLYYWSVFFYYALNAGQADEFVDVLWFFEIYFSQEQWLEKLAVIALPNHEHVTIFNHLVYLAHYALFGQINFFHYMLIGHLIVLACCYFLAEWLQKVVGWWYGLALAFGIFLNLFYWNASFWAMTALSNQAVVLFAILAARSAAHNSGAITTPLMWALLAVTTQFNGLLVLPALIASSFVVSTVERKRQNWKQLLVWAGAFLVAAAAYVAYENPFAQDHLWRYVNYTDPGNIAEYFKPSYGLPVSTARALLNIPLTFLSAVGATVLALGGWMIASLAGAAILLLLLHAGLRKAPVLRDTFWLALLLFALASVALVAIGRGFAFGPESGLLYRYRLYSFLLLVLLAGAVLFRQQKRQTLLMFLLAGLSIQLCSLHVLDDIAVERENIQVSHYNWMVDGGLGRSRMPFYPHNQDVRLLNAYSDGYYNAYQAVDSRHKPTAVIKVSGENCSSGQATNPAIKAWSKKPKAVAVEIMLDVVPSTEPLQLLFCGSHSAYLVTLDMHNVNQEEGKYWPILVLKKQLPPSQYRVLLQQADASNKVLGDITFP